MSFTTTAVSVDRSPDEVFAAVDDVRSWWTGEIERDTDEYECFDACSNAWHYYGDTNLRNRIVNGRTER